MADNLKEAKFPRYYSEKDIDPIMEWLKKYWNIKALPKGYKEFTKDYEDYQGMESLDEKGMMDSFGGHDGSGTRDLPFPIRVSLEHIAYGDIGQGISPLRELVFALIAYGVSLGERRESAYENSNTNYRLKSIRHCMRFIQYKIRDGDTEKAELYKQELEELFNTKVDYMETVLKYNHLRDKVNKNRVLILITRSYGKRLYKEKIILSKNKFKVLSVVWGMLLDFNRGRSKENPVFKELRLELKKKGVILKHIKGENVTKDVFIFKPKSN